MLWVTGCWDLGFSRTRNYGPRQAVVGGWSRGVDFSDYTYDSGGGRGRSLNTNPSLVM